MSQPQLPPQPPEPPGSRARGPVHPSRSEACRLLCAGTYLQVGYRDAVIDELYVHRERFVAPSYGFDAARVLAHALRSRRQEVAWAAGLIGLWAVMAALSRGLVMMTALPMLLIALGRWMESGPRESDGSLRVIGTVLRWCGGLLLLLLYVGASLRFLGLGSDDFAQSVGGLVGWSDDGPLGGLLGSQDFAQAGRFTTGCFLVLPLLLALLGVRQRGQFARVIAGELSRERFADIGNDPAENMADPRFRELSDRIREEQHAPLILYTTSDPFCGAGNPVEPWSLSVELRPRPAAAADPVIGTLVEPVVTPAPPEPLDNGTVLEKINPLLEKLREPSPRSSPQAAGAVHDRLRELAVDECVFLPAEGLPDRMSLSYTEDTYETQRAEAVEEGGERRRHFLRVRVGGWDEEIVVTVFVRVHTQGGMLMLEVVPHVLPPVNPLFGAVDRQTSAYLHRSGPGRYLYELGRIPATTSEALRVLAQAAGRLTDVHADTLPDGPAVSVRQLGASDRATLFQNMDTARYLKSIQDRIADGVRQALWKAGYEIAEFEQRVTNVFNNSGTFVGGSIQGSGNAVGRDSTATWSAGSTSPASPPPAGGTPD